MDKVICKTSFALNSIKKRKRPTHCELKKCSNPTRENKPYCSEHLNMAPYVNIVSAKIEEYYEYLQKVEKNGTRAVKFEADFTRILIGELWVEGTRNAARLMRVHDVSDKIIASHGKYLSNKGIAVKIESNRPGGLGSLKLIDKLARMDNFDDVIAFARNMI